MPRGPASAPAPARHRRAGDAGRGSAPARLETPAAAARRLGPSPPTTRARRPSEAHGAPSCAPPVRVRGRGDSSGSPGESRPSPTWRPEVERAPCFLQRRGEVAPELRSDRQQLETPSRGRAERRLEPVQGEEADDRGGQEPRHLPWTHGQPSMRSSSSAIEPASCSVNSCELNRAHAGCAASCGAVSCGVGRGAGPGRVRGLGFGMLAKSGASCCSCGVGRGAGPGACPRIGIRHVGEERRVLLQLRRGARSRTGPRPRIGIRYVGEERRVQLQLRRGARSRTGPRPRIGIRHVGDERSVEPSDCSRRRVHRFRSRARASRGSPQDLRCERRVRIRRREPAPHARSRRGGSHAPGHRSQLVGVLRVDLGPQLLTSLGYQLRDRTHAEHHSLEDLAIGEAGCDVDFSCVRLRPGKKSTQRPK